MRTVSGLDCNSAQNLVSVTLVSSQERDPSSSMFPFLVRLCEYDLQLAVSSNIVSKLKYEVL